VDARLPFFVGKLPCSCGHRATGARHQEEHVQIQINADNSIEKTDRLIVHVHDKVVVGLDRYAPRLSRVEVHLSDENQQKGGEDDKRCVVEARVLGRKPQVVTHRASTVHDAVHGAVGKMRASLDTTFGRLRAARR
jgi:hypothetical protein